MKVGYVFPGQGSQSVGMGKNIYDNYKSARKIFQAGNEILGFDIAYLMFNGPEEELIKTANCQPAILLANLAYFSVLNKKIPCSLALGHSIGEYSALVASEALSLEDAVKLVKIRAELMTDCIPAEKLKPGTSNMAAVLNDNPNLIDLVKEACEKCSSYKGTDKGIVQIANINSSYQIIISGNNNAVIKAAEYLKNKNIKKIVYLKVEGPFHSVLMKPAAEGMKKELENIVINKPKTLYIANSTGGFISEPNEIKESLVEQIYNPVKWEESLETAIKRGFQIFVESGSGEKQAKLLNRDYKPSNKGLDILVTADYI